MVTLCISGPNTASLCSSRMLLTMLYVLVPWRLPCRPQEERVELKEFLYLPKPNHLVYIKPTVAVVADVASRASVGLKMTIGNNQLERYVVEYYSKSL